MQMDVLPGACGKVVSTEKIWKCMAPLNSIDRLGHPLNNKGWPLLTIAMLSGEKKSLNLSITWCRVLGGLSVQDIRGIYR
jgi:hypothetical protein